MIRSRMVVQISTGKRPVEDMISQLQGQVHKGLQRRFEWFESKMGEMQELEDRRQLQNRKDSEIRRPPSLTKDPVCPLRK